MRLSNLVDGSGRHPHPDRGEGDATQARADYTPAGPAFAAEAACLDRAMR